MFIQLNGQILYYEKTGEGSPIILVHGNGETHEIFDVLIPALSKEYTVYALDTRGHGQSATPSAYHYTDMAADIAAFIDGLNLVKPALYGFSDGGIIGLLVASSYPDKLSKLIISGANLTPKDLKWKFVRAIKKSYKKNPVPLKELMLIEPYITVDDLALITVPTLVLAGEHDLVKKSVTKKIVNHIANAALCIVPGEDHGSYIQHSPKLYPLIIDFLHK